MKKVCMLGSGAWGTAVSLLLADNGFDVNMWCCEREVAKSITEENCNKIYFPEHKLNKKIKAFTHIERAMRDCDIIFEATPVKFLRSVLEQAKPYYNKNQIWVVLSKGIEQETLLFPSQIIDHVFMSETDASPKIEQEETLAPSGVIGETLRFKMPPGITGIKKVVVSGPSFAKDVAAKQITAVDIASQDPEIAHKVSKLLSNNYFKTYIKEDILGLQIGGALKNVVALAIGMLDGAGYTDNAKAFALTRFLHEMSQLAEFLGVKKEILYGLSGMGDLVLTCMGGLSRNLMVGKKLGAGQNLKDILLQTKAIPEGVNTTKSVYEIIQQCKLGTPEYMLNHNLIWGDNLEKTQEQQINMPLFECIYEIIYGDKTIKDFLEVLKA